MCDKISLVHLIGYCTWWLQLSPSQLRIVSTTRMATIWLLVGLVCSFQIGVAQHTPTKYGFSKHMDSVISELKLEIDLTYLIHEARTHISQGRYSAWSEDLKAAGSVIHMYTLPWQISPDKYDSLNRRLNRELSKSETPEIWARFARVLSTALDMIGLEQFSEVFRGETDWALSALLDHACTRRFISTTLNAAETKVFGGRNGRLFRLLNVWGTAIYDLAKIPEEMEVLIKPGTCFKVVKHIVDRIEIKREMSDIKLRHLDFPADTFSPKEVYVLEQVRD